MNPAIPQHRTSPATVLEVGERLTEAPSDRLTDIAFGRELQAQQGLAQVAVRPGQSLWSVAESADPGADTRVVIQRIIDLNGLTGNVVFAGQRLWVPRG